MFANALLTGTVSLRSLQNSPLESSCVVVALIENYSTSILLKFCPEKSQILSCDTVVASERYMYMCIYIYIYRSFATIVSQLKICDIFTYIYIYVVYVFVCVCVSVCVCE